MTVISSALFDTEEDGPYNPNSLWDAIGVSPVVGTASTIHGPKGVSWADTSTAGRIQYDTSADQDVLVLSYYIRPLAFAEAHQYLSAIMDLPVGASLQGDVRINNTTHTVSIRNGFTAVATSVETLSLNEVYRFEWMVDSIADTQELRVYEGENSEPYFTLSGAWSSDTVRVASFGPNAAASLGAIDYDTLRVADDWTGSYVNPPLETPVVTVVSTKNPTVANNDGEITISWPPVVGADYYVAGIKSGLDQGPPFTETVLVTSPYTFYGLSGGDYTVGIKAIAPTD